MPWPRRLTRWGSRLALLALGLMVAVVGLAGTTQPARAQGATPPGPVTDDMVNRVAKQLFCPVCESTPLDVCPTEACAQWRNTIREKLAAGWSDQQVLDYFVAQYGERVLARPSTRGLNILVWVVPPLALLAGGLVLWRYLRGAVRKPAPAVAPTTLGPAGAPEAAPVDEYARRLEQELKRRQ